MLLPLLSTKTYLPQPVDDQVERARLLDVLDECIQTRRRLVLISAMAGSGKSTLAAGWAARAQVPFAWAAFDGHDNTLAVFWVYLVAAVQRQQPGFAQELLESLLSPQPPQMQEILTAFLNQAEKLPALVLVLDDYHLIESAAIHESMVYLIEHLPPNLLIVLCTRSDPPMPFSRWRVRGYLLEIRLDTLRFTSEEVGHFFRDFMKLRLDDSDIAHLEASTEGWVAGLQLAALALQGAGLAGGNQDPKELIARFSASHQYVADYLTSEVLSQQPSEIRDFLLQTSILQELCGSLCDAVTGHANSAALLTLLQRNNLFVISQDSEGCWYRYHHLFASLLQIRLANQDAETVRQLHLRAAQWYEQAGRVDEFLFHALAAGAYRHAADVVNRNWRRASDEGWPNLALAWMETLPVDVLRDHPMLCMACAWTQWLRGQASAALTHGEHALHAFQQWLAQNRAPDGDYEFDTIPSQVAALRALVALRQGRLPEGFVLAQESVSLSKEQEPFAQGLAYMALATALRDLGQVTESIAAYRQALIPLGKSGNRITVTNTGYNLGRLLQVQGRLDEAARFFQEVVLKVNRMGRTPADGILLVGEAEVCYERNELDRSAGLLDEAWGQAGRGGYLELIKNGRILRARLLRAAGDLSGALAVLQDGLEILYRTDARSLIAETQSVLARYQVEVGALPQAIAWARTFESPDTQQMSGVSLCFQWVNLGYVYWLSGDPEKAIEVGMALEPLARAEGCIRWQMDALLMTAMSYEKLGRSAQAQKAFLQALHLGEPERHVRLFVDAGQPARKLLQDALPGMRDQGTARYAMHILTAFSAADFRPAAVENLPEPLSEREIQVLRLLAAGLSNKEICEQLVISLPTTKTHVRHIYEKLHAQNRVEAINRAKELGVL